MWLFSTCREGSIANKRVTEVASELLTRGSAAGTVLKEQRNGVKGCEGSLKGNKATVSSSMT